MPDLMSEVRSLIDHAYSFTSGQAPAFTDAQIRQALRRYGFAEDIALAGADGRKAEQLLRNAISQGTNTLHDVSRSAVERLLAKGPKAALAAKRLYDVGERGQLQDQFVATNAPAELLGRSRVRIRANRAEKQAFSSREPTDFHVFDETGPLEPMTPLRALDYFRGLVPELGVDPRRFGPLLERQAFTLAVATEEIVLGKVQDYISQALETGQVGTAPEDIDAILNAAGVGETQNGYSEMVFRTNALDAYNTGAEQEGLDVADTFPVWQYSNPSDGRSRPTHAEKDGNYYQNEIGSTFGIIRGTDISDVANCRCTPIFIDAREWADLQAAGATTS